MEYYDYIMLPVTFIIVLPITLISLICINMVKEYNLQKNNKLYDK